MPRPPTHRHVLRDLRQVIKMSQVALAERVGVSTVAVNRIENGSLPLSEPVALRIFLATGLSLTELMRGKNGKLLDHFGRDYTHDTFTWWTEHGLRASEKSAGPDAANLQWWIEVLLRAAARKHGGRSYHGVRASLIQAISAACSDFKLGKAVEAVLGEHSPRVAWAPGFHTPGKLREIAVEAESDETATERFKELKRMSHETGIPLPWRLLDGDLSKVALALDREAFERRQVEKQQRATVSEREMSLEFTSYAMILRGILVGANAREDYHRGLFRVFNALWPLAEEYGSYGNYLEWLPVLNNDVAVLEARLNELFPAKAKQAASKPARRSAGRKGRG